MADIPGPSKRKFAVHLKHHGPYDEPVVCDSVSFLDSWVVFRDGPEYAIGKIVRAIPADRIIEVKELNE